jgi:hypothetical protein
LANYARDLLDRNSVTASEWLELAGFSPLVYNSYLAKNEEKKNKKKGNKPLEENKRINIKTGMHFDSTLKQN